MLAVMLALLWAFYTSNEGSCKQWNASFVIFWSGIFIVGVQNALCFQDALQEVEGGLHIIRRLGLHYRTSTPNRNALLLRYCCILMVSNSTMVAFTSTFFLECTSLVTYVSFVIALGTWGLQLCFGLKYWHHRRSD